MRAENEGRSSTQSMPRRLRSFSDCIRYFASVYVKSLRLISCLMYWGKDGRPPTLSSPCSAASLAISMNRRFSRRRLGVEQMKSLRDETSADSQSAVSLEVEFRVLQLGPGGDVVTAEYSPGGGLHGRPVECLDADELRLRCGAVEVEDLEFGSARVVSDDCVGGIGAGQARREHLLRALETPVPGHLRPDLRRRVCRVVGGSVLAGA